MSTYTAFLTRVPGVALVVVLIVLLALLGPAPALGAPGDPFETARPSPPQEPPDPVGAWPLRPQPEVVAGFDPPDDPWGAGHRGVDLLGSAGQVVRAALPGRISFVGTIAGRGVVVVDHGATRTTYEPVTSDRPVGDPVARGDPIGQLAVVGSHCFPRSCLHWGWIRGEVYLNPLGLVGAGPVRLLPLWRDDPVSRVAAPHPWASPWTTPASPYADWQPLLRLLRSDGYLP